MWIAQTIGIKAFVGVSLAASEEHIILINRPFTFGRYPNEIAFNCSIPSGYFVTLADPSLPATRRSSPNPHEKSGLTLIPRPRPPPARLGSSSPPRPKPAHPPQYCHRGRAIQTRPETRFPSPLRYVTVFLSLASSLTAPAPNLESERLILTGQFLAGGNRCVRPRD